MFALWYEMCFKCFLTYLNKSTKDNVSVQHFFFHSLTLWHRRDHVYILHIRHHVRIRYMTYFELFWSYGFLDVSIKTPTELCWSSLGLDWKRTHLSVGFHVDGGNNFHKVLVHHRRCGDREKTLEINTVFNHLRRNRRSRWNSSK